ncbi:MAG: sulfatase-like hydrolase/transferase [Saprospiraceae bacterium]|nr:sulfatase-like hydrolase/transferase [Saprospiraceae bacterium]
MVSCSKNANDISNDTSDEFSLDQRNSNGSKKVSTRSTPNILLIIADDMGKDAIKGYQEGSIKPKTPNIDAIRDNGLLFTNFWVNPTCSPTRGAIITGKYGYRTDVKEVGDVLKSSETVIQKYINTNTNNKYATAVVGKWHLSGSNNSFNPESFGIDYYSGLIRGSVTDYYNWQLTEDGATNTQTNYITEKFTDLAINWVNSQSKPWFLWLAYNAPHTPFHVPPSNMHSQGTLPQYTNGMNAIPYYMAAIEAMDFQIGRLLASLPADKRENTVIIFIGDNGTPPQVAQSPYSSSKVKNTLYQGGVNVPMFISGKGVSRRGTDTNLLNGTDLFATIAHTAGINVTDYHDSKSFKYLFSKPSTIRNFQYSELKDGTTESWSISNGTYKLIKDNTTGSEQMYNLANDPYETKNLLNSTLSAVEQNAKLQLETQLSIIRN